MILEAIEKYADISELEIARSATNNSSDLWSFVESLPADFVKRSRLKDTLSSQSRSTSDNDSYITLEEELLEISANFSASVEQIIPTLDIAYISDDIIVEGNFIYMPDGEEIHIYSLEGIAIIEVLNAIAHGEDAESAAKRISEEIENFINSDAPTIARGLFINPILKWPGGIVRYTFQSNMRTEFRTATRNAMDSWEAGSNNKVRFTYYEPNGITAALSLIGALPLLQIGEKTLDGLYGLASPGSPLPGFPIIGLYYSFMYLDPSVPLGLVEEPNEQNAYSVALHELGHVLGLQHEQQRADRDNYIKVTDTTQFKIPEITIAVVNSIRIEMRSKKVAFLTIWYPVIVTSISNYPQFVKTAFDPLSIMMYAGLEIVDPRFMNDFYATNPSGTTIWKTKTTTRLSDLDKAFIRTLY
jgi:hypothetical protein